MLPSRLQPHTRLPRSPCPAVPRTWPKAFLNSVPTVQWEFGRAPLHCIKTECMIPHTTPPHHRVIAGIPKAGPLGTYCNVTLKFQKHSSQGGHIFRARTSCTEDPSQTQLSCMLTFPLFRFKRVSIHQDGTQPLLLLVCGTPTLTRFLTQPKGMMRKGGNGQRVGCWTHRSGLINIGVISY